jgi:peptide/nickel transport system ATP-binding protein
MYAGKIVEKAPTNVLFTSMRMPYTEALLKSIPKLEDRSHTRLEVITGRPPDLINPPKGCNFSPRCPYAQDKCREEEPPLQTADAAGHEYACWFPVGTPEGADALRRNLEAGLTQTKVAVATGAGDLAHDLPAGDDLVPRCVHCATELTADAEVCGTCGAPVSTETTGVS